METVTKLTHLLKYLRIFKCGRGTFGSLALPWRAKLSLPGLESGHGLPDLVKKKLDNTRIEAASQANQTSMHLPSKGPARDPRDCLEPLLVCLAWHRLDKLAWQSKGDVWSSVWFARSCSSPSRGFQSGRERDGCSRQSLPRWESQFGLPH
jgi:hypothetical protein